MPSAPEVEALLAESRWLQALARRLVAESGHAEDLAQDAWLSFMRRPPRVDRPVRAWIETVLRRRARDDAASRAARGERERRSARGERLPSTLDVVEKAELQRALVEAVLALDEPYRTTILLRFFENQPPRAIARAMAVPVATVHTRIGRGVAHLRAQLEQRYGRERWALAILPLARANGVLGTITSGYAAMHALAKTAVAVGSLAVVVTIWLQMRDRPAASRGAVASLSAASEAQTREDSAQPPESSGETSDRAPSAVTSDTAPSPAAQPERTPARRVHGRVLDLAGRALAGVELAVDPGANAPPSRFASDAHGDFDIAVGADARRIAAVDPRWSTVLAGSARVRIDAPALVVVAPRIELAGRVVDAAGAPLSDVELAIQLPANLGSDLGVVLDHSLAGAWRARSAADGSFALTDVPAVERALLVASLGGYAPLAEPVPPVSDAKLLLQLAKPGDERTLVRGVVLTQDHRPVEGARVGAGAEVAITAADGRFDLELRADASLPRLVAVARGHQPALFEPPGGAWPAWIELELGPAPLSIEGRVVDRAEHPVAGARVWIADPLVLGYAGGDCVLAETWLAGDDARFWGWIACDAQGRFRIDGLTSKRYRLCALEPTTLASAALAEVRAGDHDVTIVLPTDDVHARVRGHVRTLSGDPVAGAAVEVQRMGLEVAIPGGTRDEYAHREPVRTDAEGAFELRDVPRDGAALFVSGDDILFSSVAVTRDLPVDDVVVRVSRRVHVQVELLPPLERADTVRILDSSGQPMILRIMRGEASFTNTRAVLENGRSEVLSVREDAAALALYKDGAEVGREPITLRAGGINTLRW